MPWVNEIKLATNEINPMSEWNKGSYKWNKSHGRMRYMPQVNETKFAKNEIDTVEEWNGIQNQEWDICHEWNEFISFHLR